MFAVPWHTQNHVTTRLGSFVRQTSEVLLHLFILILWLPLPVWAQSTLSALSEQVQNPISTQIATPAQHIATMQTPGVQEKHPRLFGIVPTYSVSNSKIPSSLSSRQKFHLFLKNTSDPFTLTYTAFNAGLQQAENDLSGFGQGAAGYGKRLGAGLADQASVGLFKGFLFPSLLHQDPRYFRQRSGSFRSRLTHAIIRPVVTRKDSGGHAFNWSGIVGSVVASSLSNVYYP